MSRPGLGDDGPTTRRIRSGPLLSKTDPQLVVMTIEGDRRAYEELISRYQNAVLAKAFKVVKDYQAAEDIAQEAMTKAYTAMGSLQDPRRFGGWLMTITQNTAMDYMRARKDRISLENLRDQGFEPAQEQDEEALGHIQNREEELRVLECLRSMREDYREIIVLKHIENLSYKEIAERLGMSVSAVGEKLSRVRGILKRKLTKKVVPKPGAGDGAES
jgi:RNA polymerase sigma-70 factor (ECF subfamily)